MIFHMSEAAKENQRARYSIQVIYLSFRPISPDVNRIMYLDAWEGYWVTLLHHYVMFILL